MANDIVIRPEWDGNYSLLLDGEIILERVHRRECEQKANVLRMAILFKGVEKGVETLDKVTPTE